MGKEDEQKFKRPYMAVFKDSVTSVDGSNTLSSAEGGLPARTQLLRFH